MSFSGSLLSGAAFYGSEYYGSGLIVGGFSPASLFAAGEVGAWYDPSDLTTLFQDTAGTTPITTPGERVALMLDKSRGLALGPELVSNGDFSDGTTGWTLTSATVSAGQLSVNSVTTENVAINSGTINTAKACAISFDVTVVSGQFSVFVSQVAAANKFGETVTTSGRKAGVVFAGLSGGTNSAVIFRAEGGFVGTIDNISVRELPGNHATQSVLAQRPTYAVEPSTGRRNLLTYSEQFDNVAWQKANATITANAISAPDGATTADSLVDDGSSGVHSTNQAFTCLPNTTYTLTAYLKAGERNWGTIDPVFPTVANNITYFDLVNGVVGTNDEDNTASIESVGGGWYRCRVTHTTGAAQTTIRLQVAPATANGGINYIGNNTAAIYVWGAQLELGSTATAYQRVVTAQDVSEAGVAARPYLFFDGIDDGMLTGTITPGADKAQVVAGVRKLSDGSTQVYAELGPAWTGTNGAFAFYQEPGAGAYYATAAKGDAAPAAGQVAVAGITYAAPRSDVLTGLHDIAGDLTTLRVSGVQVAQATGDKGAGNFAALPLYIGRRGGTTLPFSGHIYGLIVRFSAANLAAAQIAATERWMAQRTGVVI
jgi:hypothetical protein